MYRGALGLIEVYGYLGAIEAADTALKAANVNLIGCEIVKGGLVTVKIEGDVSSVKAAVEAAEIAVTKLDILVLAHVIPRPDLSVWDITYGNIDNDNKGLKDQEYKGNSEDVKSERIKNQSTKNEVINQEERTQEVEEVEFEEKYSEEKDFEANILEGGASLREQLESKKVNELRSLARNFNLDSMTREQIKFARKDKLVEEIIAFYQRRDE